VVYVVLAIVFAVLTLVLLALMGISLWRQVKALNASIGSLADAAGQVGERAAQIRR